MTDRGRSLFTLYVLYRIKKTVELDISETTCLIWTKLCQQYQCAGGMNCEKLLDRVIPLVATSYRIFKNLLLQIQWTDFKTFSQKSSSADCLSDLYKLCWYLKNMATRGRSLFSLFILYRKTKTLLSLIDSSLYRSADSNQKSSPEIILSILPINHFT